MSVSCDELPASGRAIASAARARNGCPLTRTRIGDGTGNRTSQPLLPPLAPVAADRRTTATPCTGTGTPGRLATISAVVSDQYRMHRLRVGDEAVLATLARGNGRFADGDSANDWQAPLGTDEAAKFVADPNTVCIVAIDLTTNHIAGFIYGGVLNRRHTRLHHMCLYEVGVDIDHRQKGVAALLLGAFGEEARKMGIDRGFTILNENNHEAVELFTSSGALRGDGHDVLFGLQF
ncbi:MAG: hypothetical protein JWM47_2565 [Acidimicrobiales bacterium]|nr:hypothetical protein [Acidimicrobiales bacterium]